MPDILPYKPVDVSHSPQQEQDDVTFMRFASGCGVMVSVIALMVVIYVLTGYMKCSKETIAIVLLPALVFCSAGILQGMLTLTSNPRQRKLGLLVLIVSLIPFAISGLLVTIYCFQK